MPETIQNTFITQFTQDVQYLAQKEQGVLYQYYKPITVTSVDGQAFDKSLPFELADSTDKRYEATSRKFAEWDSMGISRKRSVQSSTIRTMTYQWHSNPALLCRTVLKP